MNEKRFIAFIMIFVVLLSLCPLTIISVTAQQREISYTGLVPSGHVWIAYTTYTGWIKPQVITEQTDSKYLFNVEGDSKRYILLDSFDNNTTREHFAMLETSTLKAYWDSANPSTAVAYEYNLNSTTQIPGIINSKNGIDTYISKDIQSYVKTHTYPIEGVKNGYTGETVTCKYSLLALSEYVAYADKIGYHQGGVNAFLRTPYNSSGTAQGGAVLQKGTTTNGTVTARAIKGQNAAVRPVFYFDGSFFENERVDLSTAGLAVINEILKTENKNNIYTQEEWLSIETIDISGAEETINIKSNGSKIKSGFTLIASNLPEGYQKEKFIISEDNNKWTSVNNNSSSSVNCLLTNDMAGKYIRFYAEKDGKKYISPAVLVGENLKRFLTNASNKLNEADYEMCGEIHFDFGNDYSQYGYSVLDADDEKVLLLSKHITYLKNYEKDPSSELVQKYDLNDPLSIAYKINQTSFINQYILPSEYHSYIKEGEWQTEAGCISPMDNDTVTFSKIALPANWEIENYKGGFGYGISVGAMLRTPVDVISGTSTATTQVVTENGKLLNYSQNSKGYYSTRVEFYLDKRIFKKIKLDLVRADEKALEKLDLPSIMSKEEAKALGYSDIELARLGYNKIGADGKMYVSGNNIRGYIEYVNYSKGKEINIAAAVYAPKGDKVYLKDIKTSKVTFDKTNAYCAEDKQRALYKDALNESLKEGEFVKLILWDSYENLQPLGKAEQKDNDEWTSKFYEEEFFNLVTTFTGDAKTKRGFAWQALPNCADMVIQYGLNEESLTEEMEAACKVSDVAYNIDTYKAEARPVAPPMTDEFLLFYKAELENLNPGTKYYYRIGDKLRNVWSETYSFETEKENETDFCVIGITDTQATKDNLYEQYYKPTWQAALSENPDSKFVIHTGDITSNSIWEEWTYYFFKNSRGMCETLPVMATVGNHDTGMSRSSLGIRNFANRFNYPKNGYGLGDDYDYTKQNKSRYVTAIIKKLDGTVYSYDYGNAHFSVINTGPEWGSPEDVLNLQTEWLESDLKNTDKKWKVVVCHIPIYTVGGVLEPNAEKYGNMYTTLRDIIEQNGVDLVLSGHTHLYMRTHQLKSGSIVSTLDTVNKGEGTIYSITGLSGPEEGELVPDTQKPEIVSKWHSMGRNNSILPGYNVFRFTDEELIYSTKLTDGTLIDTVTIKEK